MDDFRKEFLSAQRKAIEQAGSQTNLAKKAGMQQSRISDYLTERYDLENVSIGVQRRLFPDQTISYFASQYGKTDEQNQISSIREELSSLRNRMDDLEKSKNRGIFRSKELSGALSSTK